MPRKQYKIRVTSVVRDPIDLHQLANILLNRAELEAAAAQRNATPIELDSSHEEP